MIFRQVTKGYKIGGVSIGSGRLTIQGSGDQGQSSKIFVCLLKAKKKQFFNINGKEEDQKTFEIKGAGHLSFNLFLQIFKGHRLFKSFFFIIIFLNTHLKVQSSFIH